MDEAGVTQQYYIATRSSPADDLTRVLKYGKMFAVFDRHGDIGVSSRGEEGIFYQGTRFLSRLVMSAWGHRPLLLSSTIQADNLVFTADLANLDVSRDGELRVPRDTVHLVRRRFLWQATCYEELKIVNYGLMDVAIPLRIAFAADFSDIFEVRGTKRDRKGTRLDSMLEKNCIELAYQGLDDVVRRTTLHCEPAPKQLTGSELHYDISLAPKEQTTICLRISGSCDSTRENPSLSYTQALSAVDKELNQALSIFPRISSSNHRFTEWMRRSVADIEMMTLGNPEENYPYAGVPWFSTVFGRDGIITALEVLWASPWIAKGVLEHLAAMQAQEHNPEKDAEPGKILHEMRKGEMAALGEVPFSCYYGSVDSTPLFVMLAETYYARTGDLNFIRRFWPHIERGLQWIDQYGDLDGDGFVEYSRKSSHGLAQQGWKDSGDSVFHADGRLAEGPIALCEVQGYVYAAKIAAARLSAALGDSKRCSLLRAQAETLRAKFEEAFWCHEFSTYALALDGKKQQCKVRASNAGHCLYTGIASPEHAELVAHTLLAEDSFTGWGVRTIGGKEARYNPISYHNGSVWPHDNALVACGLGRYGFKDLSGKILMGLLDVSAVVDLHRLPELFCGMDRHPGTGPTLYPVACSPQAWAAGAVFMVLEGCLGISIDGTQHRVVFKEPRLPEGIPQLSINGLSIGTSTLDLQLERKGLSVDVHVTDKSGDVDVLVN